jgi:hypothetical protein
MRSFVRIDEFLPYIAGRVTTAYGYNNAWRENEKKMGTANGVDSQIGVGAKISAINPSACFHAPHRVFLLFVFSDMVRRTPSAKPAAEAMKSKIACGITTVVNSRCVATGSLFWTTTIATKIARTEAVMSLKFRIGYTDNARWPY